MSRSPRKPAVLVLGGSTRLPGALRERGMHVVFFGTHAEFTPAHREICAEAWLTDTPQGEEFWLGRARLLYREVPFVRAVTGREHFLITTARINDALGLGGNPLKTVLALKDKALMREHLTAFPDAVPPVRSRVLREPAELSGLVRDWGLPLIVKPRDKASSEGVQVLRDEAAVEIARRRVQEAPEALIVEEFLQGPEFSVETFSHAGRHDVYTVTEKFTGEGCVEIGHVVPARITEADRAVLAAAAQRFLDVIGLVEGPGHTEIILTEHGPRIVESHNRTGGDGIPDLVRHVCGVDMRDLLAAQIAQRPFPEPQPRSPSAATWFLIGEPGTVTSVKGWDVAAEQPGVVTASQTADVGDLVRPLGSSADRCGSVIALADTGDEALARAQEAIAQVSLQTVR